jgi:hypothetical protein
MANLIYIQAEGHLCVSLAGLTDHNYSGLNQHVDKDGVVSYPLWKKWRAIAKKLGYFTQRGGNGRLALIEFSALPTKYQEDIKKQFGDPKREAIKGSFASRVQPDNQAAHFFSHYVDENGNTIKPERQLEYTANACVLNTIKKILNDSIKARKGGRIPKFWEKATLWVNECREELKHNLPKNERSLQRLYDRFVSEKGLAALVHGNRGNDHSRKVHVELERLLLSIYVDDKKPFGTDVHASYMAFLAGKYRPFDTKTGEVFDPAFFVDSDGEPLVISEATVWRYLNKKVNRAIVDSKRNGFHQFNNMHRPHMQRKAPVYALSKISMDDRDLPRKAHNGRWVKAYYAYDVASGAVIGKSYSYNKDAKLFIDCLKDMFRTIELNGWGMPQEVEVETHLVKEYFDELALLFPFVHICAPANSQEKRAEHFNKAKKYTAEKSAHAGIGRWWAKSEAYRVDRDKVNDQFVEKTFDFETLVADDIKDCQTYNNSLHNKKKQYPGLTRWEVLAKTLNPELKPLSKSLIYKFIGEKTKTSLRRNHYCVVQYQNYGLPSPQVLDRINPEIAQLEAYYLPDLEGNINEVYLFQGENFISKAEPIERYNEARAERTEKDEAIRLNQQKYISEFDAMVKRGAKSLASLRDLPQDIENTEKPKTLKPLPEAEPDYSNAYNTEDAVAKALENL